MPALTAGDLIAGDCCCRALQGVGLQRLPQEIGDLPALEVL